MSQGQTWCALCWSMGSHTSLLADATHTFTADASDWGFGQFLPVGSTCRT